MAKNLAGRRVSICGVIFANVSDAAKLLLLNTETVRYRCQESSVVYPDWQFIDPPNRKPLGRLVPIGKVPTYCVVLTCSPTKEYYVFVARDWQAIIDKAHTRTGMMNKNVVLRSLWEKYPNWNYWPSDRRYFPSKEEAEACKKALIKQAKDNKDPYIVNGRKHSN